MAHGYHVLTYAWLAGELVRRGPTDARIGRYFVDEIAVPLGLDFWIGLPESEEPRPPAWRIRRPPPIRTPLALMMAIMGPGLDPGSTRSMLGRVRSAGAIEGGFNSRGCTPPRCRRPTGSPRLGVWRAGTPRPIGEVDGVRLIDDATLVEGRGVPNQVERQRTGASRCPQRFGLGFMLDGEFSIGCSRRFRSGHLRRRWLAWGTPTPNPGVGYGYVMMDMAGGLAVSPTNAGR